MIRILIFLALIAAAAFGLGELAEQPGSIVLTWFGYHVETSPLVGVAFVLAVAVVLGLFWSFIRFIFHIPTLARIARHAKRRARGHEAISRGILAAGAGDSRKALAAAKEARKLLPHEPLTLLLEAQTAQLSGDRAGAERAFRAMLERGDTKLLGLRGLHAESLRRGDGETAHEYAKQAQTILPLGWSGQSVLDNLTAQHEWEAARHCLEQNLRAKIVDAATANRQKAVLDTAIAMDWQLRDPDRAVQLLRAAVKKAPDLIPATALLGRLLSRKGDLRAGSKLIEAAYTRAPHPDLALAYVDMRPGDSSTDRLTRAKTLAKCAPDHVESAVIVALAALGARDFALARQVMMPLVSGAQRPTARMCVIMAELEEKENGAQGAVREWLARGSRAPRDAAWHADGVWSKSWAPVSPVTGKLDAWRWTLPKEELTGPVEDHSAPPAPELAALTLTPEPPPAPVFETPAEAPKPVLEPRKTPQPVIFPLAAAPDDPGPKKPDAGARLF